jgi:hypothetical protein
MKTSSSKSSDPYQGIQAGDVVMLLETERVYNVETRYISPLGTPILCLDAVDWSLKGELRGIHSPADVIKLDKTILTAHRARRNK